MVRFWTCLKGKPVGFADTEHGCERRAQGIWPHHQQEGAAWKLERGEEGKEGRGGERELTRGQRGLPPDSGRSGRVKEGD